MAADFIPEIHDIGKMLDNDLLNKELGIRLVGHCLKVKDAGEEKNLDFENIGFPKPSSINWTVIHEHMRGKPTEKDGDIGFLSIADKVAASHRPLTKTEQEEVKKKLRDEPSVNKLWRSSTKPTEFIGSKAELKKLFEFVEACKSSQDFLDSEYRTYLLCCPEDKKQLLNISSLYSHVAVTGKVFRFLRKQFKGRSFTGPKDALKSWKVKLIKCKVKIPQFLVKTKDLAVFHLLEEKLCDLENDDSVLFRAGAEFLMIVSDNETLEKNQIIGSLTDIGLIMETDEITTTLNEAYPSPLAIKDRLSKEKEKHKLDFRHQAYYSDLPKKFPFPICEICQLEPARNFDELKLEEKNLVQDEKSGLVENLGDRCLNIRRKAGGLAKLAEWTEDEDIKVAWIKISLNFERLQKTLADLYWVRVRECGVDSVLTVPEVRFSTLKEFFLDYQSFIDAMREALVEEYGTQNFEAVLPDMFCIRLRSSNEIDPIIEKFSQKIADPEWFDKLPSREPPIMIGISCSKVKYPFNFHWEFLSGIDELEAINIQLPFKASISLSIGRYSFLKQNLDLKTNRRGASLLHRLAMIEERTGNNLLIKTELIDKRYDLGEIYKLFVTEKLTADELLSYYKIFGGSYA